jgi:phenylacetate-CoA ligase
MFYHDPAFELRSSAISERMFRTAGDGGQFPVVLMRGRPHMGFNTKHHFFYLRGYNSVRHRIKEFEKLVLSLEDKTILYGLGSSILELARVCDELHISLPLKCVVYHGESLNMYQRKEIEHLLCTDVRSAYGMSEIRQPAFECEHNRFHCAEDTSYFEVVDEKGMSLPAGESGRLLITGFEHRVMPFLRYDTGDIGVLSDDPCPCGRTLRTLEFQGRKMKLLHVGDGRTVSLLDFSAIFDAYPKSIRQFQIVRTGECAFRIHVVPGIDLYREGMQEEIVNIFKFRIHPRAQIEWGIVDSIPEGSNGKAQYFIDMFEK